MTWLSPNTLCRCRRPAAKGGSDLHSGQLAAAAGKSEETVEELFLGDAGGSFCGSCVPLHLALCALRSLTLAGRIHNCYRSKNQRSQLTKSQLRGIYGARS